MGSKVSMPTGPLPTNVRDQILDKRAQVIMLVLQYDVEVERERRKEMDADKLRRNLRKLRSDVNRNIAQLRLSGCKTIDEARTMIQQLEQGNGLKYVHHPKLQHSMQHDRGASSIPGNLRKMRLTEFSDNAQAVKAVCLLEETLILHGLHSSADLPFFAINTDNPNRVSLVREPHLSSVASRGITFVDVFNVVATRTLSGKPVHIANMGTYNIHCFLINAKGGRPAHVHTHTYMNKHKATHSYTHTNILH